ncbi:response regulator [Planctomycetota bacterium]
MPRKQRILTVDDEVAILELLENILGEEGYDVDSARNAEEAIAKLRIEHYDLVLTDFKMPGKSGIDVATEVRALHMRVPVLVLTASTLEDEEKVLRHLGVYATLPKPIRTEVLCKAVKDGLRNCEEERREVGRLPAEVRCGLTTGSTTIRGKATSLSIKGLSFRPDGKIDTLSPDIPNLTVDIVPWNVSLPAKLKHLFQDPDGAVTLGLQFAHPDPESLERIRNELVQIEPIPADFP